MKNCFKLKKKDKHSKARTGVFRVKNRVAKTPFFMPVATKAVGKFIGSADYNKLGVQAIISNSLILYLNPGTDFFKKQKGIHNFMKFKGIIFTDSGGFQMLRNGFFIKRSKRAVHFKDPNTNQKHVMIPQKVIDIELAIGSDVAMVLDDLVPHNATISEAENAVENTNNWAKLAIDHHESKDPVHTQKVFGICQGGFFEELRKDSAKQISELNFDGIAIGGVAVGESRDQLLKAVKDATAIIPEEKIKYVMGVGNPLDIVNLVDLGCDCFDSIYPTQNARHGTFFTFQGRLDIMKAKHKFSDEPIEANCDCELCKNFSRAYIRYLLKNKDPEGKRLASVHNIRFMMLFMKKIRNSIAKGKWPEFRDHIRLVYTGSNNNAGSSACTLK